MNTEAFELIFDGDDIHDGEMDVYALAPALLSIGDLFRDADRVLNGQHTYVKTSVRANFKEGSFEILLHVEQILRNPEVALLPAMYVIGCDNLVSAVIGNVLESTADKLKEKTPEVVQGLFKLLSKLGGETPKEIQRDSSNHVSIFVMGNGNTFNVDQKTTDLYEDPQTLLSASKTASPLQRDGITELRLRRNSEQVAGLKRGDVPNESQMLALAGVSANHDALKEPRAPQELVVKLIVPNFEDGKWYVSDGGRRFSVTMDDEQFKERVHSREVGFYDGDLYRVEIATSQHIKGKRLITTRSITKVISPVERESQQEFPNL